VITHIYVSNYGTARAGLELALGPLTALVGPAGSGKGCLLDAARFLAECASGALDQAAASRRKSGVLQRLDDSAAPTTLGVAVSKPEGHGFWPIQLAPGVRDGVTRV
jgi:hypothetical protein